MEGTIQFKRDIYRHTPGNRWVLWRGWQIYGKLLFNCPAQKHTTTGEANSVAVTGMAFTDFFDSPYDFALNSFGVRRRMSLTQVDRGHFLGDILIDVRDAECEQGGSPRPMEELRQNEEVDGPRVVLGRCV